MTLKIGNKGFTLIEVLVAAVILFAGLGAVLKAYSLAVVAMEAAADKLAVSQIIQQKIGAVELQISDLGDTLPYGQGRQEVGGAEFGWQVQSSRRVMTSQISVICTEIEVGRFGHQPQAGCIREWTQFRGKKP